MPTNTKTVANVYNIQKNTSPLSTEETTATTAAFVQDKLNELQVQLDLIPQEKKEAYQMALKLCPELVSEDDKLAFLRFELFQPKLAATRLVTYWTRRLEVFGPDKAFLPLTLKGALRDDSIAMQQGVLRLIPHHPDDGSDGDGHSRTILFVDPSRRDLSQCTAESRARVVWYVYHVAMEEIRTQNHGLIVISNSKDVKRSRKGRAPSRSVAEDILDWVPIRLTAIHVLNPPPLARWIHACCRLLVRCCVQRLIHFHNGSPKGENLERLVNKFGRIHIHNGSQQENLQKLSKEFGLEKRVLPVDIGGDVPLDHAAWLQRRMEIEMEAAATAASANK